MWWLVSNLPPESALVRAEDPAAVWTVGEHLLATVSNWLAELTYVTVAVNSEEKAAKRLPRPEPIIRPGEKKPEPRRPRQRPRTVAIDPRSIGGVPMETTATEGGPA